MGFSSYIRPIRFTDAEWLRKTEVLAFGEKIAWSLADYIQVLNEGCESFVVAKWGNNEPLAVCFGNPTYNRYEILSVFTDPAQLRKGYAKWLLEHAGTRAAKLGKKKLRLEVWAGNAGAIRLYESLGYRTTKKMPNYYGRGKHAIQMETPGVPLV